ncbi:hypothetical protein HJG60_009202 [Phyllostomus discolor]|uniref:Uncharacterized protein n=1 Tax=Phyllostomus discolor TaxID=89673 RepID=A0A833YQ24_9CHIR|nr:hypothetical protein HJG60_009202 [Phyllostomus discolor]
MLPTRMLPITRRLLHAPRGWLQGAGWNEPSWGHRPTARRETSQGNGEACARREGKAGCRRTRVRGGGGAPFHPGLSLQCRRALLPGGPAGPQQESRAPQALAVPCHGRLLEMDSDHQWDDCRGTVGQEGCLCRPGDPREYFWSSSVSTWGTAAPQPGGAL